MLNKELDYKLFQSIFFENHEIFEKFFNRLEELIIICDSDNIINFISKKGTDFFDSNEEDIVNKNIFNLLPAVLCEALLTGENFTKEISTTTKLGEEKLISWNIIPLKDKQGNIAYTLISGNDKTTVKKDDKVQQTILKILEAANSERDLYELFKSIHTLVSNLMPADNFYIALYDKESDQIQFPYFIDKNEDAPPAKKLGKGLTEYVLRSGKPMLLDSELDKQLTQMGEIELIGSDSLIWLGIPLKIEQNTIGVLVVQDYDKPDTYGEKEKEILELISYPISRAIERKKLEAEREEFIKNLKDLNASKDKLFSLISHDLRSPFNSLLGFSEILNTEYDTLTEDEIKEYLKVIYEASKNLFGMTNNLLQYSRFQMGRIDLAPSKIKLLKIINNSVNLLKGNAIKKDINLSIDVDNKIFVNADEDMLNSVFQNLISNAVKFTHKGGSVKISAKLSSFFNQSDFVEVTIEDTGVGMSKGDVEKIFKNFMYTTPGTDKEYGTGLGLLLVKEFVEKHGGRIKVSSKVNQGTTFIFSIPLAKE